MVEAQQNVEQTIGQMCKSARAMGLSKTKWLRIEDHVTRILVSSGPEFTIQYLKDLKQAKLDQLTGQPIDLSWHKVNRKGEPCGWQSELFKFRKAKTSIQVIGAMVNAIEISEPTPRQLDKWKEGVRNSKPAQPKHDLPKLNLGVKFDRRLAEQIANQEVFQPIDVTGTSIPLFNSSLRIGSRTTKQGTREKNLETTLQAYMGSINSAPAFVGQMMMDQIQYVEEYYPDLEIKDREERLILAEQIKINGENLEIDPPEDDYVEWVTPRLGMNQRVGQIAFLEQPGGKLRTIANPNRVVQHAFRPLQKVLSSTVNSMPQVAVENQQSGIEWAQQKLSEGLTLHSFDLSAATDTLDAEYFAREILTKSPLTDDQLEYFGYASKALWYSEDLGKDVNWSVGQPLGLAPSFAMLTTMNCYAGQVSASKAGLTPEQSADAFRVVGDDFICISEVAHYYPEVIQDLGGEANPEKALVSNKYGEFCSQLITSRSSWPLKPKVRGTMESFFVDIEKSTVKNRVEAAKVPKEFRTMADYMSSWSSSDIPNLPSIPGNSSRRYPEKIGVSAYLSVVSLAQEKVPDLREISVGPAASLAMEKVDPKQHELLNLINSGSPVDKILANASVRMRIDQTVTVYDWRTDERLPKVSSLTSARKAYKTFKKIEESSSLDGDILVLTGLADKYHKDVSYEMLFDTESGDAILFVGNDYESFDSELFYNTTAEDGLSFRELKESYDNPIWKVSALNSLNELTNERAAEYRRQAITRNSSHSTSFKSQSKDQDSSTPEI